MLTTNEVCECCGVAPSTLQGWIEQELFAPAEPGGKGRGNTRRFSVMQAVGIAVAAEIFKTPRSCATSFVGRVVRAFTALPEAELQKRLKGGRTHFATLMLGDSDTGEDALIVLDKPRYEDRVNVKQIYETVKQVAAK